MSKQNPSGNHVLDEIRKPQKFFSVKPDFIEIFKVLHACVKLFELNKINIALLAPQVSSTNIKVCIINSFLIS